MKIKVKKPPVIRRGQKKPFIKATVEQINERIELVENLLGQGAKTGQIKKAIIGQYNVSHQTCMVYISRARDAIRKRFGQNKDQHRKDSFAFYEAIAAPGGKASAGARLRARQRIDELLGLDSPRVTQISGPDGGPIQNEVLQIEKPLTNDALRKMIDILEHGTNSGRNGNGSTDKALHEEPAHPGSNGAKS